MCINQLINTSCSKLFRKRPENKYLRHQSSDAGLSSALNSTRETRRHQTADSQLFIDTRVSRMFTHHETVFSLFKTGLKIEKKKQSLCNVPEQIGKQTGPEASFYPLSTTKDDQRPPPSRFCRCLFWYSLRPCTQSMSTRMGYASHHIWLKPSHYAYAPTVYPSQRGGHVSRNWLMVFF